MKYTRWIKILIMVFVVSGCQVPSVHPLYSDDTLIFETALIGTWVFENGGDRTWILQQSEELVYDLEISGIKNDLKAYLLRLGEELFLDIYIDWALEEHLTFSINSLDEIPAHTFLRVWLVADTLRLAYMDQDWLEDILEDEEPGIGHEYLDNLVILTAETAQLQEFIYKYRDEAFDEPFIMSRQ